MIAPYWDNLDPSTAGNIYAGTVGTAPNRRFVVSWVGVPRLTTTIYLTFQMILDESTGDIIFQYRDVAGTRGAGRGATVGVENAIGDTGVLYLHNGAPTLLEARTALRVSRAAYRYLVLDKSSLWFNTTQGETTGLRSMVGLENAGNLGLDWSVTSGSSWLTVSNATGVLAGGQTTEVAITLNEAAAALTEGSHETTITFANLTDGGGNITIPVTIRVAPSAAGVLELIPASSNLFGGSFGGPFQPTGLSVQLRNSGSAPLNWNASADGAWVEATPVSGTLAAGESSSVLVRLTSLANALAAGEHVANVQFVNASLAGSGPLTQSVRLQVNSRPVELSAAINNGRFEAVLSAPSAGNYAVEYSADLQNWQTLSSVPAVGGGVAFDDALDVEGRRFYRLRLE